MIRKWRQTFHLEPPSGWLNDPNGLCFFSGEYHVFFQYCPDSAYGVGRKCWGHFISPDLLEWSFVGIALKPDTPYDRDGVYSGSAVVSDGKMRLYYTGNVKLAGDYDYVNSGRQSSVLTACSSDGLQMSEKKLLLSNSDYPSDCSCHVRDPKVWIEDGVWRMVLGARSRDSRGLLLVYHSADGLQWRLSSVVETKEPLGYMWECPDCFRLDGRLILSVSPQGLPHEKTRFQNVYQSGWFTVNGCLEDGVTGTFTEWDAGFDFYAPQTFTAPDGRRILIGWMGVPDSPYKNPTSALGWQHCLTVPRELFFDGEGRLCQRPVRELEKLYGAEKTISDGEAVAVSAPFVIKTRPQGSFSVTLGECAVVSYDARERRLSLKFTDEEAGGGRGERLALMQKCRDMTVLVDTSSLEIYADGGSAVMSTRFYPRESEISVRVKGTDVVLQPMKPMNITNIE